MRKLLVSMLTGDGAGAGVLLAGVEQLVGGDLDELSSANRIDRF